MPTLSHITSFCTDRRAVYPKFGVCRFSLFHLLGGSFLLEGRLRLQSIVFMWYLSCHIKMVSFCAGMFGCNAQLSRIEVHGAFPVGESCLSPPRHVEQHVLLHEISRLITKLRLREENLLTLHLGSKYLLWAPQAHC